MQLPEYTFKGQVNAQGLLLPKKAGIRKSIITLWQSGYSLYEYDDYFLVMFPQTLLLNTIASNGFVVKKLGSGFSTGLWPQMSKSKPLVILHLAHGEEIEIPVSSVHQILPSDWLELSDYQIAKVTPFASPLSKPDKAQSSVGKESRTIFGDEFKVAGGQRALLDSLANQAKKPAQQEGFLSYLWHSSKIIASSISFDRKKKNSHAGGIRRSGGEIQDNLTRLGFIDKIREKILASRMGSIVGWQNARYLKNMMDMFDRGDFEKGLKNAIPLSSDGRVSQHRSAGFLSARDQLSFNRPTGGGSVNLEDQFFDYLRKMYELSFRQLDRAERYKEAAFVKAELLQQNDEAIKYLEGKKMYVLAAELAEARGMPPTRIIRQWLLAGNKERALWYAVATGEFVNAISLLENRDKHLADEMRKIATERFISTGRYLDAIEIGWPVEELREGLLQLLDKVALDISTTAMKMRVKGLILDSAKAESYALELINLFEDTSFQSALVRQAVINELIKISNTNIAVSWVTKAAIKSYYHDVTVGYCHHNPKTVVSLLNLLKDDMFRFDIKKTKLNGSIQHHNLLQKSEPTKLQVKTVGYSSVITDIILLQSDYCLVALGDIGMLLVDPCGKIIQRYNQPVDTFIESDERQLTLCLSHRSSYLSVFEFNWLKKGLTAIGDYKFGAYATSYDGALWFVSEGNRLSCIDLKSKQKKIFWQVGGLPGEVVYIKRSGNHINCLIDDESSLQFWKYRFPDLTLESREPVNKVILENAHLFSMSADGDFVLTALYDQSNTSKIKATWHLTDSYPKSNNNYIVKGIPGRVTSFASKGKWIYLVRHVDDQSEFNLIENSEQDCFEPKLSVQIDTQENIAFSEYSERVLLNSSGTFVIFDSFSGKIYTSYSLT